MGEDRVEGLAFPGTPSVGESHFAGRKREVPVAGATVSTIWSGAVKGADSCITGGSGECTITKNNIRGGDSVTFSVTGVTLDGYTYNASDNHESSIILNRP